MVFPIETSSAETLARTAEARGFMVERFYDIRPGFLRLTHNDHVEYTFQSQSNLLGRVTARIFSNKAFTSRLLREASFPVPDDILAHTADEAAAFLNQHNPIVLKPLNATGGKAVKTDLTTEKEVRAAFQEAEVANELDEKGVVCQQQVSGRDFRLLVIDLQHVFAVERVPAFVVGDGQHTIQELLDSKNIKASAGYDVPINETVTLMLTKQGLSLDSVPEQNQHVRVMQAANSHLGGTVVNIDEEIGEHVRQTAIDVAKHFNYRLLGLDCLSENISQSIGHIIELNESPALYKHEHPDIGAGQPVATIILDMLFPETKIS